MDRSCHARSSRSACGPPTKSRSPGGWRKVSSWRRLGIP